VNLTVTTRPPYGPPVEFVERKGAGHPDTICDALAEGTAQRLALEYLANTGAVQPFNVDKALLAAGTVKVDYGGGVQITRPRLILTGKADFSTWQPSPEALAADAQVELGEILPDAPPDFFDVEVWLTQSSAALATVVEAGGPVPIANDTSFAAVSLPLSPLERAVHEVDRVISDPAFRGRMPVGADVKVMGARSASASRITVAVPVLAGEVHDREEYDAVVTAVAAEAYRVAAESLGAEVEVAVNQADREDTPYLTVSGTSAESGDDGQVGRGNRFGGLITPYRPMSMEAAAGKNPAAHVGKTYHAAGFDIASRLIAETGIEEATVRMLSSIGAPVTHPQAVHVEMVGDAAAEAVGDIVEASLGDWAGITERLVAGHYELY